MFILYILIVFVTEGLLRSSIWLRDLCLLDVLLLVVFREDRTFIQIHVVQQVAQQVLVFQVLAVALLLLVLSLAHYLIVGVGVVIF